MRCGTVLNKIFSSYLLLATEYPSSRLAATSPPVIGYGHRRDRFFFKGQISEIVTHDRVLDQDNFDQVAQSLMQKYKIQSQ